MAWNSFNLETDPHELSNVDSPEIGLWPTRLIEHLAERGPRWVLNGKLALRPEADGLSPNYPRAAQK